MCQEERVRGPWNTPLLDTELHTPTSQRRRCFGWLPLRYVVALLGMLGCMMDYLVRIGLSVAIVAMVNNTQPINNTHVSMEGACPAASNASHDDDNQTGDEDFEWSLEEQGIILGTFFWGYFFTKTIGGRISEIIGGRETMAISLGVSGLLSMLCPYAAHIHPMALASIRFIIGLVQGPAFPALYSVLASWAPPDELATTVTIAYSGLSMGSLVALGASEWVVHQLGWQWVFWGGGILAVIWTPLWLYFVRNSPIHHPLISTEEEELLAVNFSIKPRRHVPWGRLLRCWRFYPSILTEFSSSWVGNQTITEAPFFLKMQIGMRMTEVSWVLAIGHTCAWVWSFCFGRISDLLIQHCILSKLNTRRSMHVIATVLVVVGLLCIVWGGCQKWVVSAMLVVVMIGSSCTICTFTLSPLDLAPNYAGTMSGLLGIGNISGFLAPIATAEIITKTSSWTGSLLLGGGLYLLTGIIYIATVTTEVQDWNYYEDMDSSIDDEEPRRQPLLQ
ncbi:sialin-like [Homarus americanus]|uniref:sialin-like n=1 Tax=Homarus americanus TaxID=6706 RepID=UPI001C44F382|nr:sialin-like [Homarus americanus]